MKPRSAWVVDNGDGRAAAAGAELVADLDMAAAFDPVAWRAAGRIAFTDADPVHIARVAQERGPLTQVVEDQTGGEP